MLITIIPSFVLVVAFLAISVYTLIKREELPSIIQKNSLLMRLIIDYAFEFASILFFFRIDEV